MRSTSAAPSGPRHALVTAARETPARRANSARLVHRGVVEALTELPVSTIQRPFPRENRLETLPLTVESPAPVNAAREVTISARPAVANLNRAGGATCPQDPRVFMADISAPLPLCACLAPVAEPALFEL